MASDRPISLRLSTDLIEQIDRRTTKPNTAEGVCEYGRADAIRGALNRYYEVCRRHMARLDLSRVELAVCCYVLNRGMSGRGAIDGGAAATRLSVVWAEVADALALSRGSGEDHGVSDEQGARLVAKLQTATYADICALVDFAERFWADDPDAHAAAVASQ